jgi:hypothetical protein
LKNLPPKISNQSNERLQKLTLNFSQETMIEPEEHWCDEPNEYEWDDQYKDWHPTRIFI